MENIFIFDVFKYRHDLCESYLEIAFLGTKTATTGEQMALYERDQLPVGAVFNGPALTFQFDSTVYIAAGWRATVDGYRNLILERQ